MNIFKSLSNYTYFCYAKLVLRDNYVFNVVSYTLISETFHCPLSLWVDSQWGIQEQQMQKTRLTDKILYT